MAYVTATLPAALSGLHYRIAIGNSKTGADDAQFWVVITSHVAFYINQQKGSKQSMKARILILAATILAALSVTSVAPATGDNPQKCPPLSSGKIDVGGSNETLVVTAPEGFLIAGYCVKAGSARRGDGPEFYPVIPAQESVEISHSSGKDISHYSLLFVEDEGEEEPPNEEEPPVTPPAPPAPPTSQINRDGVCMFGPNGAFFLDVTVEEKAAILAAGTGVAALVGANGAINCDFPNTVVIAEPVSKPVPAPKPTKRLKPVVKKAPPKEQVITVIVKPAPVAPRPDALPYTL